MILLSSTDFFSKNSFRNTHPSVKHFESRSGQTEDRHSVGTDLCSQCLEMTKVKTSKKRVI